MAPAPVADPGALARACDRVMSERDAYVAAEAEPEPELEAGL